MNRHLTLILSTVLLTASTSSQVLAQTPSLARESANAIRKAAKFYREKIAVHGGYVYFYTLDLKTRWGEGRAQPHQIWVQPPGTPTVGMAFLEAYAATGDQYYIDAARNAADALVYGQLSSGGWTNSIDLEGRRRGQRYWGGRRRRDGNSSLDDGQTQSAIRFLVRVDKALQFKDEEIHGSVVDALKALLAAQFANGGFPQVWTAPVSKQRVIRATYPNYDWRTEGRIKEYWDMYTLNDNVCGYVTDVLIEAHRVYRDDRYLQSLRRLGDFLLLAQMPDPQPAWAQQYNYAMKPIWARKFEPAAIAGDESQEALETLLTIAEATGDNRYLKPIPAALAYLRNSLLPDGRLARYYELKTNRPLYMNRRGKTYSLTYDDSQLPKHYGWKMESRLDEIEARFKRVRNGKRPQENQSIAQLETQVRRIIGDLDEQGRWLTTYKGERLVGQPKFRPGDRYISSEVFSRNIETLSRYLLAVHLPGR